MRLLAGIDEEELATKVSAYISEMERLHESMTGQLEDKRMMPIKGFSFEDKIIRNVYYENEKLARKSITELREFNEIATGLMDIRHKWYELGIALGVPKAKLDEIDRLSPKRPSVDLKMRLMLQHAQEIFSFKFTWKRLIDALIDLNYNSCVESVESIAPKHSTSLCQLDVYRRQDFISRRIEDKRLKEQVKEIRNILELDPTITDDQILSNLFQHISSKKADLSSEERIIEALRVIQKLSLEHALEGEQEADDIVDEFHCQACYKQQRKDNEKRRQDNNNLCSALTKLDRCMSSIAKSKETLQQAINYIKETKPYHEDLLNKTLKGVSVVGFAAGVVAVSVPLVLAAAFGVTRADHDRPENPAVFEHARKQHIKKLEEFKIIIGKDLSEINKVMDRVQTQRDSIRRSYQ